MNASFWKGRKVFITGHTGFKGSWLSLWLQHLSAEVVGFALPPPTEPSLFEAADVAAGMQSIVGDVRDHPRLRECLAAHRPEIVLHLAAQSVVRTSYQDPAGTYATNVMGTVNLLDALRNIPGRAAIVNVTTDKVYRNNEWVWGYRECDTLGGRDPYSNSKACSELVTQAFADSYFADAGAGAEPTKAIATARAGNVIGGGDWTPDQLVPDVVKAFSEGRQPVLRSPQSVRPWQFVLDCLAGYLTLAERLFADGRPFAGAWNFGPAPEDAREVRQIVERLGSKWPLARGWRHDQGLHPHEAGILKLDSSKSIESLGWQPRLAVDEALDWIADWYLRYYEGAAANSLCLEQIRRFESLAPPTQQT
jgi:CDP-glucose 4,6-dehydratase